MQVYELIIEQIMKVFQTCFDIFGYSISLWSVFVFIIIGSVLITILINIYN